MKIVKPSFEILSAVDGPTILRSIEAAGRTCYKSESKVTYDSSVAFVRKIIASGHESVIEHVSVSVRIICDRGVSHEIVRHRLASYSQESTRYCNYGKVGEVTFIEPCFWPKGCQLWDEWEGAMQKAEHHYLQMLNHGATPQQARSVLPNSLKTELVMTCNLREWRHFFRLRTASNAHPQMREIAIPMLAEFKRSIPTVFDDILTPEVCK